MAKRTIKVAGFMYRDDDGRHRFARRGEEVDLNADAIAKGEKHDAFGDPSEFNPLSPTAAGDEEEVELGALSTEELSEWLSAEGSFEGENKPKVDDVVAAASGDIELAKRLLAAENDATGNDPRTGVVEGLTAVVERASE